MRSKKHNESQPICAVENIPLFVMYLKKELPKERQLTLGNHIATCIDCKMNFAYVEEILQFKHVLTIDEKTLLLRYLSDPLWYHSINSVKNQIREEVLSDIKPLLKDSSVDLTKLNNNKPASTLATIHTIGDKNNSISAKLTHKMHPVVLAVVSILIFSSLSVSIYLIIDKQHKLYFSASSRVFDTVPVNNEATSKQISIVDHYQQLDLLIDKYLDSKDNYYLEQAEMLALNIKKAHGDDFATDLVSYYKSASPSAINQLISYRKEMFRLINQPSGDNLEQRLKRSQKLEKDLFEIGNKIEAYRVRTITSKAYLMVYNYDLFKSTSQEGLNFSQKHNYLFLQGYFLLWQAKQLSETENLDTAEKAFLQTVEIGQKIGVNELVISSNLSLATLYHLNNDNQKCLKIAQSSLLNLEQLKKSHAITLMQLAGLAAANLKNTDLANQYLKKSLELTNKLNNHALTARSYIFLSLASAELKQFSDSEQYYSQAMQAVDKLTDKTSKLTTLYVMTGYYGKLKLLEGNFNAAAKSYEQTLDTIKELKINNNLELSQINEGLAMALTKLNQLDKAQQYVAIANHHRELAENNKQIANCFLSFTPTVCSTNPPN